MKLYITWKTLQYRRDNASLFSTGASYVPLRAAGDKKHHVCAFAWRKSNKRLLVIAPVLLAGLTSAGEIMPLGTEAWGQTYLVLPRERAGQTYRNIFTSESITTILHAKTTVIPLADIFKDFPVAALELV